MADYIPFPQKADSKNGREAGKRLLGCFGLGGLTVAAMVVLGTLLIGSLSFGESGCDFDLDLGSSGIGDPGKGTASKRLAVEVTPRTALADGSVVRVTSDAFEADSVVGVAVCLRAADTQAKGVDACDEVQGARYATDAHGRLDATYAVPRVITVRNEAFDCAAQRGRCLVVAADAGDYDRSGGRGISFRAGLPPADLAPHGARPETDHLPIGADPAPGTAPLAAGTDLTVLASGFQPGEPLLIAYCSSSLESKGVVESCEPLDAGPAVQAIMFRSIEGDLPRADASGAFTTTLAVRPTVRPYGTDLGRALEDADDETATTTTTTIAGPSTTTRLREGERRCTAAEGGCSIVIAAAADTKRSAVLAYVVAG